MKRIITQVALAILCVAPLAAEDYPIDLMIRDMGYTSKYMTIDVVNSVKKSNADAKAYYATKKLEKPVKNKSSVVIPHKGFEKEDILQPRISEAAESSDMIPALLRYHKENPKADKITRKLAITTYSLGQYKEALYWYTLTYQRNRSDLESLWNMATIADSLGEKDKARVYLREYSRVDPNSAWGRMARNLLANGYSSDNMSESFEDEIAKVLDSSSSSGKSNTTKNKVKTSNSSSDDGMIVVSGDKYDLESFVASYRPKKNFDEISTKDGDTVKGKSQTKVNNKKVENYKENNKMSLEKASVPENSKLDVMQNYQIKEVSPQKATSDNVNDESSIKAVATPLGD